MITDKELSELESSEWIAVFKPGLLTLIKELTEARIKIQALTAELSNSQSPEPVD